jgi:glutathione peroxidase
MLPYDDITLTTITGEPVPLGTWRGRVLFVVNVASGCGYTPQYAGLEALWRKHRDAGLAVLGFPCDQFGHQEPGTEEEIRAFCSTMYDVTFPLFAKTDVNGPRAHPLWRHLKRARPGLLHSRSVKWNFTKFLVSRDGEVVKRYSPTVEPGRIEPDVVALLAR